MGSLSLLFDRFMKKVQMLIKTILILSILSVVKSSQSDSVESKISDDPNDVDYTLFTRRGSPFQFKIDVDPQEILNHGFDPSKFTKIVTHGWVQSGEEYCKPFVDAYIGTVDGTDYNVICVDWDKLATIENYLGAAINSNTVGDFVGEKLVADILMAALGQLPSQIHAIGHSLGAHLVGHIGRSVETVTGFKIARVTGLDPAKPYFDLVTYTRRMLPTDAEFVDVIHTNSGDLLHGAVSLPEPVGQVDFYPNGGVHQAGCEEICITEWACIGFDLIDFVLGGGACSHKRAHKVYVESIRNPSGSFLSLECDSYESFQNGYCNGNNIIPMGEGLQASMLDGKTNLYYLDTNGEPPYSKS